MDRQEYDDYVEMTGIRPGYIKGKPIWYGTARINTDSKGENLPYAYSYLFAYPMELPAGAKTITLPIRCPVPSARRA